MLSNRPTILISGASGFTGTRLFERLFMEGYGLVVIKRSSNVSLKTKFPNVQEVSMEAIRSRNERSMSLEIDSIVHLATLYNPSEQVIERNAIWEANVELPSIMLNYAKEFELPFMHVESYLQFEPDQSSMYLESKRVFSEMVEEERKNGLSKILSLVFFDNYGSGDRRSKLLDKLILSRLNGRKMHLEFPRKVIILTAIEDVIDSVILAMNKRVAGRYRVNGIDKFHIQDIYNYINNLPSRIQTMALTDKVYAAEKIEVLETFAQKTFLLEYLDSRIIPNLK